MSSGHLSTPQSEHQQKRPFDSMVIKIERGFLRIRGVKERGEKRERKERGKERGIKRG